MKKILNLCVGVICFLSTIYGVEDKLSLIPENYLENISLEEVGPLRSFLAFTPEEQIASWNFSLENRAPFLDFLRELKQLDNFYSPIGGIKGYQQELYNLLHPKENTFIDEKSLEKPPGFDITEMSDAALIDGLLTLPFMGEMYPVGGAGDRLNLMQGKISLPAALLPFLGKTLLDLLFQDLEAREYLYYHCFGQQLVTPVALMTSVEKDNHRYIQQILEQASYFNRPKESVRTFIQPLVPLVTKEGLWVISEDFELRKKPCGHGVIWKLAQDFKIFDWFFSQGRTKGLVRQINNPIAGIDHAFLTFMGLGAKYDKKIGFLSCLRRAGAAEGMNVLVNTEKGSGIVNIEYTDFLKNGVEDKAVNGSEYSLFPCNTNLLFIDFKAIEKACHSNPFPGPVYNPKTEVEILGKKSMAGRLESAMQNISDSFIDKESLASFVAYNERKKTISVTKKAYHPGMSILDTPIGCFYDLLSNHYDLLTLCGFEVPELESLQTYDPLNPPFLFYSHSALGPPYSVIAQKLLGGKISEGSELSLDLAEVFVKNLSLTGSLQIIAHQPLGHLEENILQFSSCNGKAYLENVVVKNRGVNFAEENQFWKKEIFRHETFEVILEGDSMFYAKDVVLEGGGKVVVPDRMMVVAVEKEGKIYFDMSALDKNSPLWGYSLSDDKAIELQLKF